MPNGCVACSKVTQVNPTDVAVLGKPADDDYSLAIGLRLR